MRYEGSYISSANHVNKAALVMLFGIFFLSWVYFQPRLMTTLIDKEWDILIFTQNWPTSVCLKWKHKSPSSPCLLPNHTNEWTIHGIWPTKLGTLGPWFCDPSKPFNIEGIYGIMNQLENQWMRIEQHKKKYAFWKHEWDKHGTCAAQLESLDTELLYFSQGLAWNTQYNVTKLLSDAGLSPGAEDVSVPAVIGGIKAALGHNPFVSCYSEGPDKPVYLLEVKLCFNKSLALTDCDGVLSGGDEPKLTDCPVNRTVLYPPLMLMDVLSADNDDESPLFKRLYNMMSIFYWSDLL